MGHVIKVEICIVYEQLCPDARKVKKEQHMT
jgi:hypothetical protein